jgi:WD40 repeat protein
MYYTYSYKTLYKHDFSTNEIVKQYNFPQRITARNSSTNGRFMVIGCEYWWIQVWDTWMDELLIQAQVIPNQFGDPWTDAIIDLIISSDGKYVQAKGYSYREYRCYSLEKKRNITIYNELPGYATPGNTPAPDSTFKNPILFLPQGFGILDLKPLDREYTTPHIIDLNSERVVKDIGATIGAIVCVDGNYLLSRNSQGFFQFWDVSAGLEWKLLSTHEKPLESGRNYHISPGGHYIYSSSGENFPSGMYPSDTIKPAIVLDALTGRLLWELNHPDFKDDEGYVLTGAIQRFSEDGTQMFGMDKTGMHIWDITNLKAMAEGSSTY